MATTMIDVGDDDLECIDYPCEVRGIDHWTAGVREWPEHKDPDHSYMRNMPKGWFDCEGYVTGPWGGMWTNAYVNREMRLAIDYRVARTYYPVDVRPKALRGSSGEGRHSHLQYSGSARDDLMLGYFENARRVWMPTHIRLFKTRTAEQLAVYTHFRGNPINDDNVDGAVFALARSVKVAR